MRRFPSLRPSLPPPGRRTGQDKDREGQQVPHGKRHKRLLPSLKHGTGQAFVLPVAMAMGLILLPGPQSAALAQAPRVRIADGVLRGTTEGGVERFLGIPYAQAPLGDRRWTAPEAAAPWEGIRVADRFGPSCAQGEALGVFGGPSQAEDCLSINVFRPKHRPKERLPVMLWVHGGGLVAGASADYDPAALVRQGVIVVTFNYRLGLLGFLAHPSLDDGSRGAVNYGLLDQQAALRWVQDNIAAFAGDPGRVTLFGESAGGASVYAQMASPGAAGLFQQAIVQSGGYAPYSASLAEAQAMGQSLAREAGCADATAACLRHLPVEKILALQSRYPTDFAVDGQILPLSIIDAFTQGRFHRVSLLAGNNRDEGRWFVAMGQAGDVNLDDPGAYDRALRALYGESASRIATVYPLARHGHVGVALGAVQTDSLFACPGLGILSAVAGQGRVFAYEFQDDTAQGYMPEAGFPLGAAHSFELPYLFEGFRGASGQARRLDAAQARLSRQMVKAWTRFAKSGQPMPVAQWPAFTAAHPLIMGLGRAGLRLSDDYAARHQCAFWHGRPTPWSLGSP